MTTATAPHKNRSRARTAALIGGAWVAVGLASFAAWKAGPRLGEDCAQIHNVDGSYAYDVCAGGALTPLGMLLVFLPAIAGAAFTLAVVRRLAAAKSAAPAI